MQPLTEKQKSIYNFISHYINKNGYSPSIRDISKEFSISTKAVHDSIKRLEKKGAIEGTPNISRSIRILKKNSQTNTVAPPQLSQIPLLGDIAAGIPILSEENYEGSIPIATNSLKQGQTYFALNVKGDSMINAGINDGDTAIFEKTEWVPNGTIIVAKTSEGAITLKRFFKESNRFCLQAENDAYSPIYSSNVQILGKLFMLIRQY